MSFRHEFQWSLSKLDSFEFHSNLWLHLDCILYSLQPVTSFNLQICDLWAIESDDRKSDDRESGDSNESAGSAESVGIKSKNSIPVVATVQFIRSDQQRCTIKRFNQQL